MNSELYPFINVEIDEQLTKNEQLPIYKEIAWDYIKNEPILENRDFKIVTENEAIKVWVYKTLFTERFEYPIYSWNYGCEMINLMGQSYTFKYVEMETKRYIKEALLVNPYIVEVNILDIKFSDSKLSVRVNIKTIYGEVDVDVRA